MVAAARASALLPVFRPSGAGLLAVAWGTYVHASNLAGGTVIQYCRVPAGATVVGGWFQATDLDTNNSEEIDIDIGWAANGDEIADTDGFGNLDVLTGDASVHMPVAGIWVPFAGVLQSAGPKTFNAETVLTAIINVDAATGGTGRSSLYALYTCP